MSGPQCEEEMEEDLLQPTTSEPIGWVLDYKIFFPADHESIRPQDEEVEEDLLQPTPSEPIGWVGLDYVIAQFFNLTS